MNGFWHEGDKMSNNEQCPIGGSLEVGLRLLSGRGPAKGSLKLWQIFPIALSIRTIHLVIIMGNDLIDHRQAEEELQRALQAAQASNAKYERAISMISDIIWSYDVEASGEHVDSFISPVADRMLGLPDGTIANSFEKFFSYVHPDDLPAVQEILSEGIRVPWKGQDRRISSAKS